MTYIIYEKWLKCSKILSVKLTNCASDVQKHTEECGKGAHVFLHQRINLVFGEASDPVAVHLSLHDAAGTWLNIHLSRSLSGPFVANIFCVSSTLSTHWQYAIVLKQSTLHLDYQPILVIQ